MSADKAKKNTEFKRIVVKFGTSLLTGGTAQLDERIISQLVEQVSALHKEGRQVLIVTSGAVAAGRHKLGLNKRRRDMPFRQVLASIGQGRLMNVYDRLFSKHDITIGQALLTRTDLADRAGYLNARNTLLALMDLKVIGIVNENDVVAIDELQQDKFGENDNLSAMVANLVDADLLLILGDTPGLHTADPNRDPDARLIPNVESFTEEIEALRSGTAGEQGSGGISTKIEAARLATSSGVTVVVADGRQPEIILKAAAGENVGTRFLPVGKLESRQRWMMSGLSTRGKIIVDSGAALALKNQKRSLLAAGIMYVEGNFKPGDVVNIFDSNGNRLGCGLSNYSSADLDIIKGVHSDKIAGMLGSDFGAEVVHRNNLVVL